MSYVLSSVQLKQVSKPAGKTVCTGPQFQKLLQQRKMAPLLDCQWSCIFSGFDCQSCLFKVVVAAFLVALLHIFSGCLFQPFPSLCCAFSVAVLSSLFGVVVAAFSVAVFSSRFKVVVAAFSVAVFSKCSCCCIFSGYLFQPFQSSCCCIFSGSLLQAINGAVSSALCMQVMSEIPQQLRSEMQAVWDSCLSASLRAWAFPSTGPYSGQQVNMGL